MSWVPPQNSQSPRTGRSPASHKRRSMVKCDSCRKKRIKCEPTVRSWPGQRCIPCEDHDLPCGPNVHSRHSTAKFGNTSSPGRTMATNYLESQAVKTRSDSTFEAINILDCPLGLVDLKADWSHSTESLDAFPLDCLESIPFEKPQRHTEACVGRTVSHGDDSLLESISVPPGLGSSASTEDLQEIDQSFIRLGELRILFEAVESRTRAVASLTHESTLEFAKNALKFISWCTAKRHDAVLSSVISLAERLDARVAEGAFLRALRALEELDSIDSRGGSARKSQTKLRSTIMQRLSKIYLARNDIPEAEHWLRCLDMLPNDCKHKASSLTARELAHSLQRTSKMAQRVLDDLELDQDIRAKLRFSKLASFPAIHRAILAGHVKSAQILSNLPAASKELDLIGRTALHVAAETGQVASLGVEFMADAINGRDVFQCTPLFLAACNGNVESFAYLFERGADAKARISSGQSALAAACSAGHQEVVQYLQQKGIESCESLVGLSSPLSETASHGHMQISRVLREKEVFLNYFATPHPSTLETTIDNPHEEISEMAMRATSNNTMPHSGCLLPSEKNPEDLSSPSSPILPMQFLFSESSSTFGSSNPADHEPSTCGSADSGFCDTLNWPRFGASELSICEDIWPQGDFPREMGGVEFATLHNPLEIV